MSYSAQLRALFEVSIDGILLTAPDGRILAANPAACRLLGRSEHEICMLGRDRLVDTTDERVRVSIVERARTGRFFGEITMLRGDGSPFPAEISSVIYTSDVGEQRAYVIFRDITERRRAAAEQRVAIDNLQSIIENSPLAIVGIDPRGNILVWNQAATRLFGWSANEVMGMPNPLGASEHEPHLLALRNRSLAGETLTGIEIVRQRKDGVPVEVSVSTTVIRAYDGRVVCALALFEDIGARKAAEQSRLAAEHADALRKLALGVRHYMNNTIAAVHLELDLVLSLARLSPEARQGITSAKQQVSHLAAIVRRLDRVEELETVPYLGETLMIDVSPEKRPAPGTNERS